MENIAFQISDNICTGRARALKNINKNISDGIMYDEMGEKIQRIFTIKICANIQLRIRNIVAFKAPK